MHLRWPFKPRNGNRDESVENDSSAAEARPDFLCVGAQKGGTSWLYQQLAAHPDFWMPPIKELHYFDKLSRVKKGERPPHRQSDERDARFLENLNKLSERSYIDVEQYAQLFAPKGSRLSGDISPTYSMLNDEVIERIVDYLPEAKVIFLARDPVERAWSQLSMGVRREMVPPFDASDPDEVIRNLLNPGVLALSYPSKIVARWKRCVRPDLFQVYFFDDLENDPAGLRRSILRFFGSDPDKPSGRLRPDQNKDAGVKKLRLTEKVSARVAQFFKEELHACAAELNGPAKSWPARYGFALLWWLADWLDDLFLWLDWVG
ncbi:MAG TPA: sulfotransferase [Chthoniobacterales bacterium]